MSSGGMGEPMKSGRRSLRMAGGNTSEVNASLDKDRPPLYVPQRRESGAAGEHRSRDQMNSNQGGYQPKTSFSYVPSAELAQQ